MSSSERSGASFEPSDFPAETFLGALQAVCDGDFSVRLPGHWTGIDGKGVYKTFAANMEGGAIGGLIEIRTASAFENDYHTVVGWYERWFLEASASD